MIEINHDDKRPKHDYINDLNASFVIDPEKAALVAVDLQYATGSRTAGLGKKLAQEGKLEELAGERFDRIENVVIPNTKNLLAFFRQHGLRGAIFDQHLVVDASMGNEAGLPLGAGIKPLLHCCTVERDAVMVSP